MKWGWHVISDDDIVAECVCESLRDWLKFLVRAGGPYEVCDDPRKRMLGMRRVECGSRFMVPLVAVVDRPRWGIELPRSFVDLLKTPGSRDKLAWVLSVGDHCLEF